MSLTTGRQILSAPSRGLTAAVLAVGGLVALEALVGLMLPTLGPATTMMVALVLVSPMALLVKADHLVIITLVALFFTRLLVMGGAPSILNFVHFPLAMIAFVKLLRIPAERNDRFLVAGLIAFLGVTLFAAVVTSWQALRPFLSWITLAEPFIFFGLISAMEDQTKRRIRNVALGIAIIQLPLALLQFAANGVGDGVQGTLVGQGAGHHIMGAICVASGWMLLTAGGRPKQLTALIIAPLLAIGVLADAKQVYGALIVAVAVVGVLSLRGSGVKVLLTAAVALGLILLSAQFYAPLKEVLDTKISEQLFGNKIDQMERIGSDMGLAGVPVGLGPGNGISRTALSSVPDYANVPSLIVGTEPAELADDELNNYDTMRVSSAASPFSSWLGIYSDIGLLGLVSYAVLLVAIARKLRQASASYRQASFTLLVLAAVLGFVFTWLEEPGFTVFLAVLIASGIPARGEAQPEAMAHSDLRLHRE